MFCQICKEPLLSKKSKVLCSKCYNKKHNIICTNCNKNCTFTPHHYIKLNKKTFNCKQCKLQGVGNPNYGNRWSETKKIEQSKLMKSKVDEDFRRNCSKGMKGKKVSEETKKLKNETMIKKYGKLSFSSGHTESTKKKIGLKSKEKFTENYYKKIRKINEDRGLWIPKNKKNDYVFYRELSNWKNLVINENIIGYEKLKIYKMYDKNNRNKNSLVRDHMFGRKNGFNLGVFPEIIRHPANCQIISHSENIKKSKKDYDSVISLDELFDKIKNWSFFYEEQEKCLIFVEIYEKGIRYSKENYIL
jgi:hypothetical protein